MSEHTPGPWFVSDRNIGCAVGWIGKVRHDRMADGNFGLPEADAHLIAAAPELLAVAHVARELVSIAFHCHQDEVQINGEWVSMSDVRALVYAAIAKAEGRGE